VFSVNQVVLHVFIKVLELIIWNKGKYFKALEHYQQALEFSLSYLPSETDVRKVENGCSE